MKRKLISMILALCMLVSLLPTAALAASSNDFSDFQEQSYWAHDALRAAVDNGLLQGSNGSLMPKGILTRAQMAAVLSRAFGAETKADISRFTDVNPSAWYRDDIAKAVQMAIFQGGADNTMRPDDPISRQEAFTVLARAFKLADGNLSTLDSFADKNSVSDYAKASLAAMIQAGYVNGSGGYLLPQSSVTREQFAQVMYNMVSNYFTQANTYTSVSDGNLVIRTSGVKLKSVTFSGDLIIADGVGSGGVVLDGVTVTGRIVVRGGGTGALSLIGSAVAGEIVVASDGAGISADGSSTIGQISVNAKNVSVNASGGTVTAGTNVTGTTVNGKALAAGASTEINAQAPSTGGGGGGGGTPPAPTTATSSMTISPASQILAAGSYAAAYTVMRNSGANDAITWASSDDSIAAVDSNGKVGAKKSGTVTITAEAVSGVIATATVIVREPYQMDGFVSTSTVVHIAVPGTYLSGGTYHEIIVDATVGTGDYALKGVTVGTLTTNGGGIHSGNIYGGSITTLNVDGTPTEGSRVVLSGGVVVGVVNVSDNATIETPAGESASVGSVTASASTNLTGVNVTGTVTANDTSVNLSGSSAPNVTTTGTSTVTVDGSSSVDTVNAGSGNTTITGTGTVPSVSVTGNVTTNVPVNTITASNSAAGVTANNTVGSVTGNAGTLALNNSGNTSVTATAATLTVEGASAPVVSGGVTNVQVKADENGTASVTVTSSGNTAITTTGTGNVGAVNVGGSGTATVNLSAPANVVTVSDTAGASVTGDAAAQTAVINTTSEADKLKVNNTSVAPVVPVLDSIAVTTYPKKLSYAVNGTLDPAGMVVSAYYTVPGFSGKVYNVVNGTVGPVDLSSAGTKTVEVSYSTKTATFPITVVEKKVSAVSVKSLPTKLVYEKGENLAVTGGKLNVAYTDSSVYQNEVIDIASDMVTGNTNVVGTQTITVTYEGKATVFTVTVKDFLAEARATAAAELNNYTANKLFDATYSAAGINSVKAARDAGQTNIASADTIAKASDALTTAKAAISSVKTQDGEWTDAANAYKSTYATVLGKTVETIAVTDKAAVNTALVGYSALASGVQQKLTTQKSLLDSLLNKIATLEAAQDLATAKSTAQATLTSAKDNYNTGYMTNSAAITTVYNNGKTAISAAATTAAVTTALDAALAAMAAVKSDAVVLSEAKVANVAALNAYKTDTAAYDLAGKGAIDAARKDGAAAINAATSIENAATALTNAKFAIDAVQTMAEKLSAAKIAAKSELSTYRATKADSAYRALQLTDLGSTVTNGNTAIDKATTYGADATVTTSVAYALKNAKAALDAVKTDAVLTAEELASAKTAAKAALNTEYTKYSTGYTVNYTSVTAAKIAGVSAIEGATTYGADTEVTAVAYALKNAKAAMAAFDSDAVVLGKAKAANTTLVNDAKSAVTGATYTPAAQASYADEAAINDYIKGIVTVAVNNTAVTAVVTKVGYTAPTAGDEDDPDGTNGSYQFTVTLSAGKVEGYGSSVISDTTGTLTLTVTATAFDGKTNAQHVSDAQSSVENYTYTPATQAAQSTEAAVKSYLEGLVGTAKNNSLVTASVNKVSYTAPIMGSASDLDGTNGSYVFTVTLTKGTATATTNQLTLAITATAMSVAPEADVTGMAASYTAPYDADITLAAPEGANCTYQWQKKAVGSEVFADIASATARTYTITATVHYADHGTQYRVVVTNTESGKLAHTVVGNAVTLTVEKGSQVAPAAPTLDSRSVSSITLNGIAGGEYSSDGNTWVESNIFSDLTAGTEYSFYVRLKATDDLNASPISAAAKFATLPTAPSASDVTINYAAETVSYGSTLELFAADKNTAIPSGSSVTGYFGATVYVRVAESGSIPASDWAAVAIPARLAAPTGLGTTAVSISGNDGIITGVTAAMEYKHSADTGYTTVTGTTVTGLAAGEYLVRYAATTSSFASPDATVSVTTITTAQVTSLAELTAAIANENALDITVVDSFAVTGTVTTTKPVTVAAGKVLTNLGLLSAGSLTVNGSFTNGSEDGANKADLYITDLTVDASGSFTNNPGSVLRIPETGTVSATVLNKGYIFSNSSAAVTAAANSSGVTGKWRTADAATLAAALADHAVYGVWLSGNASISAETTISKLLTVESGATLTIAANSVVTGQPTTDTTGNYTSGYGAIRVGGTLGISSDKTLDLAAAQKAPTDDFTANSGVVCGLPGTMGTMTNSGTVNLIAGTYDQIFQLTAQGGILAVWNLNVTNEDTGTINDNFRILVRNSTFKNNGELYVKPSSQDGWMPDAGSISIDLGGTYIDHDVTYVDSKGSPVVLLLDVPEGEDGSVYICGVPKDALGSSDYIAPFMLVVGSAQVPSGKHTILGSVTSDFIINPGSTLSIKGDLTVASNMEVRGDVVIESEARLACDNIHYLINYKDYNPEKGIENVGMLHVGCGASFRAKGVEYIYDSEHSTGLLELTGDSSKLLFTGSFSGDENAPFLSAIGQVTMKNSADLTGFYTVVDTTGTLTVDSGVTLTTRGLEVRGNLVNKGTICNGNDNAAGNIYILGGGSLNNTGTITGVWHDDENNNDPDIGWYDSAIIADFSFDGKKTSTLTNTGTIDDSVHVNHYLGDTAAEDIKSTVTDSGNIEQLGYAAAVTSQAALKGALADNTYSEIDAFTITEAPFAVTESITVPSGKLLMFPAGWNDGLITYTNSMTVSSGVTITVEGGELQINCNGTNSGTIVNKGTFLLHGNGKTLTNTGGSITNDGYLFIKPDSVIHGGTLDNRGTIDCEFRYGTANYSPLSTVTVSGSINAMAFVEDGSGLASAAANPYANTLLLRKDLPDDGGTDAQRTFTLTESVTIPEGKQLRVTGWIDDTTNIMTPMILVIPSGKTLTVDGDLMLRGTVRVESGGSLVVNGSATLTYKGNANTLLGTLENAGTVTVAENAEIDCGGNIGTTGTFTNNGVIHTYFNSNTGNNYPQYGTVTGAISGKQPTNTAVAISETQLRSAMTTDASSILISKSFTLTDNLTITKPVTIAHQDDSGNRVVFTTSSHALTVDADMTVYGSLVAKNGNVLVENGVTATFQYGGELCYYSGNAEMAKLTVNSGGRIEAVDGGTLSFGNPVSGACGAGTVVNSGEIEVVSGGINIQSDKDLYSAMGELVSGNMIMLRANRSDVARQMKYCLWAYLEQPDGEDYESYGTAYTDWGEMYNSENDNWSDHDASDGYAWLLTNGINVGAANGKLYPYGATDYHYLKSVLTQIAEKLGVNATDFLITVPDTGIIYTMPIAVDEDKNGTTDYYTDALSNTVQAFVAALGMENASVTTQAELYAALQKPYVREIHITADIPLNGAGAGMTAGEGGDTNKYFSLSSSDGFQGDRVVYVDSGYTLTIPSGCVLQVQRGVRLDINGGSVANNGGIDNFGSIDCANWESHYYQAGTAWKNEYIDVIEFAKKVGTKLGSALTSPTDNDIEEYTKTAEWPGDDERRGAYALIVKYGGVTAVEDEDGVTRWHAYEWLSYGEAKAILGKVWSALYSAGKVSEETMPSTVTLGEGWQSDWLMAHNSGDELVNLLCEAAGIGIAKVTAEDELVSALATDATKIYITADVTISGSDEGNGQMSRYLNAPGGSERTIYVNPGFTLTVAEGVKMDIQDSVTLEMVVDNADVPNSGKLVINGGVNVFGSLQPDNWNELNLVTQNPGSYLNFYPDMTEFGRCVAEKVGERLTAPTDTELTAAYSGYKAVDNWPGSDSRLPGFAYIVAYGGYQPNSDENGSWWEPNCKVSYTKAMSILLNVYKKIDTSAEELPGSVAMGFNDDHLLSFDDMTTLLNKFADALPLIEDAVTTGYTVVRSDNSKTVSGIKFTKAVTIVCATTDLTGDTWGGDIRFENCEFAQGVTLVYYDAARYAVDFTDSCTVTGGVSVIPGESTTLWKNNNVELRGAKGLTVTATAPAQVSCGSGSEFTLNGVTVTGTYGDTEDENWFNASIRYNCDAEHADGFIWTDGGDHSACVTGESGSTAATTSPEFQLSTGDDGGIKATGTALACNIRVEGNADISALSVDSQHSITVSDNNRTAEVNIGSNTVFVYDATGGKGYSVTGTGIVRVNNSHAVITLNGKSLGIPHIFNAEESYQIFIGIGSQDGLTFKVEQCAINVWTELTSLKVEALDGDNDGILDKLHLQSETESSTWITDPQNVRLTVTATDGASAVYEPLYYKDAASGG